MFDLVRKMILACEALGLSDRLGPASRQQEAADPWLSGVVSGTRVATTLGWRPVETIVPGDRVLSFDSGPRTVAAVTRQPVWDGAAPCPEGFWPLEVPAGSMLGNRDVMHVMPDQALMLDSDVAEDIYGDAFVLLRARALSGSNGICPAPPREGAQLIGLHFERDEVVFAEAGALMLCPAANDVLAIGAGSAPDAFYSVLPLDEARRLAARLADDPPHVAAPPPPPRRAGHLAALPV